MNTNEEVKYLTGAVARVYELLSLDGDYSLMMRTYIVGGGCSGFEYGHTFDKELKEGDLVIDKYFDSSTNTVVENNDKGSDFVKKISFVVDPISLNYLIGAEIDYVDDLTGSRFVVKNPNASSTCSCGSSFTID